MRALGFTLAALLGAIAPTGASADDPEGPAPSEEEGDVDVERAEGRRDFDTDWDYGKPAETRERFEARLSSADDRGAEYRAELLTQIARTHGLEGDFEKAHAVLDRVASLVEEGDLPVARVRLHLERGRAFNSAGDEEKAVAEFRRALEHAKAAGAEFHAVDAVHMLGITTTGEASVRWHQEGIRLAEGAASERARSWLGALLNNLAWTQHDAGAHAKALATFEKALAHYRERREENPRGYAIARWAVARAERSLGRHEEALAELRAIEKEAKDAGEEVSPFTIEEIGENLWAMGREDEARPHLRRAWEALKEIGWVAEDTGRIESLRRRAGVARAGEAEEPGEAEEAEGASR